MTSGAMAMTCSTTRPGAMGGGVASGLMALALQPVFETTFNLATPSKLLELREPQSAPAAAGCCWRRRGTYHHSIIAANLARGGGGEDRRESACWPAQALDLHDVGKLKRPLYFKENQMGENPHDHTDPYVSAAIVTTHTRDGLQLAQKYRLPHGDPEDHCGSTMATRR